MKAARHLPHLLCIIVKRAGIAATTALVREFGGQRIYVPKTIPDDHRLVLAGGRVAADAIKDEYGGENIIFPKRGLDPRHVLAVQALNDGKSINEVVRTSGLGHCQVKRLRAALRGVKR